MTVSKTVKIKVAHCLYRVNHRFQNCMYKYYTELSISILIACGPQN